MGSGRFGGKARVKPNGKPERDRDVLRAKELLQTQQPGQPLAAGQVDLVLVAADAHRRHDRYAGAQRRPDVAGASVEVDLVGLRGGPEDVVVATREHDGHPARAQHGVSVLPGRREEAGPPHHRSAGAEEQHVVRQHVERPVGAELVEEGDGQHRHVHGDHPAGVVRDHQGATGGRDVLHAGHLGPEPRAYDEPQKRDQAGDVPTVAIGQPVARLLLGDLVLVAHRILPGLVSSVRSLRSLLDHQGAGSDRSRRGEPI